MSLLQWASTIEKLVSSNKLRLVLASASPRRKEILASLLLSDKLFTTETSGFEETLPKSQFDTAGDYALATATGKVKDIVARRQQSGRSAI
jgi:predicted house-cleaning NTP pyrophosphatase (Maf/HAM1 superfamily)